MEEETRSRSCSYLLLETDRRKERAHDSGRAETAILAAATRRVIEIAGVSRVREGKCGEGEQKRAIWRPTRIQSRG